MKEINLGNNLVEVYNQPIQGRLFVIGDLHGCYTLLMNKLAALEFNFQQDLLVSVGDLVDRGNENLECLSLIDEPWFKAIRGNHEQMCIEATVDDEMEEMHAYHGGAWLYQLPLNQQETIIEQCRNLPIILEIHHNQKTYGFVHADIHINDWEEFKQEVLKNNYFIKGEQSAMQIALWHRGRVRFSKYNPAYKMVTGVDEIYFGHTVVKEPIQHENCFFIDTGAVFGGSLTVLEI
ncbi:MULTISPECIES: metallophosphoesterase [unclassified Acinetobacter]|uniref:metallophosphoesterase n=1 Tax=unclassified Acinetobacter TaxID=196816 RepID=UPI0024495124|nr:MULTISPECIES: metallophosphoesterase [unclassified Acinetobacter]MDH0033061.1 metallophosphoesterase [Acinetobacter sp. GD04021]MDH0888411.1 metallophosphoesterase [Acinetobacter sp. GD03873]MDH1084831.1 metallophosphoesterase [Acinetobacter sp. GD03983]MDH2191721.1 metallophosphoesterase [Acinetobacter sp. GD03645]MDH2205338.1 metallophosphoesterase [Acinetobacter sp. GD03647]